MVILNKPKGITVLIMDKQSKKSKSFTVYNISVEETFEKTKFFFNALSQNKDVNIEIKTKEEIKTEESI